MKATLCLLLVAALLSACQSPANKINSLAAGMSKAQVLDILGPPRETTAIGDREILLYKLTRYRPPLKVPLHEEYQVMLRDGHVFAFGRPRDLARSLPKPERAATQEIKTINLNITGTNSAPVQPNVHIEE